MEQVNETLSCGLQRAVLCRLVARFSRVRRMFEADKLLVPDRGDETKLAIDVDIAVVRTVGVAEIAVRLENLETSRRIGALLKNRQKIRNQGHGRSAGFGRSRHNDGE